MHPVDARWAQSASTDPQHVRAWLRLHRRACMGTAAGEQFDVLELSAKRGFHLMARWERAEFLAGPVLATDGRLLVFTALRGLDVPVPQDGRWLAHGEFVLLPPAGRASAPVRWVVPPTSANSAQLPEPDRVLSLLCAQPHRSPEVDGS